MRIQRIFLTQSCWHPRPLLRSYHEKVVKYFENPPNVGSLKKSKQNVGTGVVGSMACGDQLKFQIEVGEDGVVKHAVFKAFGCGSAVASSSYATELVKGKHIDELAGIKNSVKLHCSMLAEDAIKQALDDYKKKNTKAEDASLTEPVTEELTLELPRKAAASQH